MRRGTNAAYLLKRELQAHSRSALDVHPVTVDGLFRSGPMHALIATLSVAALKAQQCTHRIIRQWAAHCVAQRQHLLCGHLEQLLEPAAAQQQL
jgi:hypothetical protein